MLASIKFILPCVSMALPAEEAVSRRRPVGRRYFSFPWGISVRFAERKSDLVTLLLPYR